MRESRMRKGRVQVRVPSCGAGALGAVEEICIGLHLPGADISECIASVSASAVLQFVAFGHISSNSNSNINSNSSNNG